MIQWALIAKIVEIAYDAYKAFKNSRESVTNEEVLAQINRIASKLDETKLEIISKIQDMRLADLEGDVIGLGAQLRAYKVYNKDTDHDTWLLEGERLREVVDHGVNVLSDLEALLNHADLDNELEFAAAVFSLFAAIIPLRASAMVERTYTYQTSDAEWIPSMMEQARVQVERLEPKLREHSDSRFRDIFQEEGEPVGMGQAKYIQVGYYFMGERILVDEVHPNHLDHALQNARRELRNHKKEAFQDYLCVRTVQAVKANLS